MITNLRNLGFSKAHNQAIKISKGEYVLVLNDDIIVKKGTLSSMILFLEEHPNVGMVGCRFIFPDGSFQESSFRFPQKNRNWLIGRVFGVKELDHNKLHKTDYVMGAFMMMPKSVLDKVGLFDEQFFIFCEEIDLAYRIKKAGYEIWYNPIGEIIHYHGVTTRHHQDEETRLWFRLLGFKNMFRWYRKNYGLVSMWVYKVRTLVGLLVRGPDEDTSFEKKLWKRKVKACFKSTL